MPATQAVLLPEKTMTSLDAYFADRGGQALEIIWEYAQDEDTNENEVRPLRPRILCSTRIRGHAPRASRNTKPGPRLSEHRSS